MPATAHRTKRTAVGLSAVPVAVWTVLFAVLLQRVYAAKIAPLYAYAGLGYRPPVAPDYLTAVLATVALALTLPRRVRRPSDFILWLLFVFAVAPCLLVSQYNPVLPPQRATSFGLVCGLCFLLIRLATARGLPRLNNHAEPARKPVGAFLWPALAMLSFLDYFLLAATSGIHLHYLTFSNVYSVRSDFVTGAASFPLIGYLVPLQASIINPLFIAAGIMAKRRMTLAAGLAGELLIYSSQGEKSVLFAVPGVAVTAWALRRGTTLRAHRVLTATTVTAALFTLIDVLARSSELTGLFVRRSLVVPGILPAAYAAVFDKLPRTHFSEFLPTGNPYPSQSPVHIVGQQFVGDPNTAANVSWLGHGFLSWGYGGMVVESLVIAVLLLLADQLSRGLPLALSCSLFFMPTVALASGSVFTTILTHGFAVALLVAWRMPRDVEKRQSRARRGQSAASAEAATAPAAKQKNPAMMTVSD